MNLTFARRALSRLRTFSAAGLLVFASGMPPQSHAEFDPVNDDTDIFLANPDVESQRPNVLIYVDNTANWNQAFDNEMTALASVVSNLTDAFNVGLMLFPETGGDNDSEDGGYVRFSVRQMTTANKSVFATDVVGELDKNDDAGNNATTALGLREAYRYFAGKESASSFGKIKTDFRDNDIFKACPSCSVTEHPATDANLGDFALDSNTDGVEFNSPIAHACQNNFIIYISNGPANENTNALEDSEDELEALGYDTSTTLPISPNGQQGNWADEWAKYMANADVNEDLDGDQNVFTYVIEVDPGDQNADEDMTALMKSVALNGKGEYFAVSSGNAGQAVINALNQIFQEIQAVNSVFASTTLPVSVNVRGTNLNQVYIGVFRPDEAKQPRWFGNLKLYQLGFDSATSTLFLADAGGDKAENPETGFINSTSPSFWTESSSFWDFRTADENGAGGSSDLPDGDLVEKGGAAQQQRLQFPSSQTARNLYTCTQGTVDCVAGSSLSATPFDTANDGVNATSMQLGVEAVTSLTGFASQSVTALTDTRTVESASTAANPVSVTVLDSGVTSQSVTSISTSVTKSFSALTNSPVVKSFNNLDRTESPPSAAKNPVTATINGHGYSDNTIVHIAGVGSTEYNGSFAVDVTDVNTFKYDTGNSNPANNPTFASATATTTSSIVNATTSTAHGFTGSPSVVIANVVPSSFNGTYTINVTGTNTFTFTTASTLPPVTDFSTATVTGNTTTATATTAAADHGYDVGETVTISGASIADYNITTDITAEPAANKFSFTVPSGLATASNPGIQVSQGSTTVTVTAPGHAFTDGQTVTITGGNPSGYNGSFEIFNVDTSTPGAETFQYTTGSPQPANTGTGMLASSGTTTEVTASAPGHLFGDAGDTVSLIIDGVRNFPAAYNGTVTATIVDENTFTYPTEDGSAPDPADTDTGITARMASATAFATVASHGYGSVDDTFTVTIKGASDSDYNRSDVTATVVNDDVFKYPLLVVSAQGTDASTSITSSIKTTTAKARAANHGFADGDSVTISGATDATFNDTFTIDLVDADNFTFTLSAARGDATGTIVASSGAGAAGELDELVNWIRGADNAEDEDGDSVLTDIRSSVQGDVLHSRPAVVNYNRHGNDDDVYIFYGSNDGVFRAVKGGFNQSDVGEAEPGQEVWGFIPEEFFGSFSRLRDNEPNISSSNKKPYFADGTIGVFTDDVGDDGIIDHEDGDRVWLFISMRRGGRVIYAIDVSDPDDPKFLWKKTNNSDGMGELGQTWSAPVVTELNLDDDADPDTRYPVVIFGAGYDATVEDVEPSAITAIDSTTGDVTAGAALYERGMGRGVFVLEAETGDILWQAGPAAADPTDDGDPDVTHHFEVVSGMNFAIPSDVVVITDRNGAIDNRVYAGDTGGNMWRIDMQDTDVDNWTVTKLATISDHTTLPAGNRKILFPPDVVYSEDGYDAVLVGSGDREHPFDESVVNRFYMFKDAGTGTTAVTSGLEEDDLFDATLNCIQDEDACTGADTPATALAELNSLDGWYITLGEGEKVVGNSVTLNSVTFFNTNQPSTAADSNNCTSDLGIARQYKVLFSSAEALLDQNIDGATDALDRATVHPGGGYLPSPVPVVVEIDGQTHEGVISGVAVDEPPGSLLNARLRKFWFKEME